MIKNKKRMVNFLLVFVILISSFIVNAQSEIPYTLSITADNIYDQITINGVPITSGPNNNIHQLVDTLSINLRAENNVIVILARDFGDEEGLIFEFLRGGEPITIKSDTSWRVKLLSQLSSDELASLNDPSFGANEWENARVSSRGLSHRSFQEANWIWGSITGKSSFEDPIDWYVFRKVVSIDGSSPEFMSTSVPGTIIIDDIQDLKPDTYPFVIDNSYQPKIKLTPNYEETDGTITMRLNILSKGMYVGQSRLSQRVLIYKSQSMNVADLRDSSKWTFVSSFDITACPSCDESDYSLSENHGGNSFSVENFDGDDAWEIVVRENAGDSELTVPLIEGGMCNVWQAPNVNNCGSCDDNGDCGKYECMSLGLNCRYDEGNEDCVYCGSDNRNERCDDIEGIVEPSEEEPDVGVSEGFAIEFLDNIKKEGLAGYVKRISSTETSFIVRLTAEGANSCRYSIDGQEYISMIGYSIFTTGSINFPVVDLSMDINFRCDKQETGKTEEFLRIYRTEGLQINFPEFFNTILSKNEVNDNEATLRLQEASGKRIGCKYSLNDGDENFLPNTCNGNSNCLYRMVHNPELIDFFSREHYGNNYNVRITCRDLFDESDFETYEYQNVFVNFGALSFSNLRHEQIAENPLQRKLSGTISGGLGNIPLCKYKQLIGVTSVDGARVASRVPYEYGGYPIIGIQQDGSNFVFSQNLPTLDGSDRYYGIVCQDGTNSRIEKIGFIEVADYVDDLRIALSGTPSGEDSFADVGITITGGLNGNADCWYKRSDTATVVDDVTDWNDAILVGTNGNSFSVRLPPEPSIFDNTENRYWFKCEDNGLSNNVAYNKFFYDPDYESSDNVLSIDSFDCSDCDEIPAGSGNFEGGLTQKWTLQTSGGLRNGDADCYYKCPWTGDFVKITGVSNDVPKLHNIRFTIGQNDIRNNVVNECDFECRDGLSRPQKHDLTLKTYSLKVEDIGLYYDASGDDNFRLLAPENSIGTDQAYLIVKTSGGLNKNGVSECRYTNELSSDLLTDKGGYDLFKRDVFGPTGESPKFLRGLTLLNGRAFVGSDEVRVHRYPLIRSEILENPDGTGKSYNYFVQCRDKKVEGRFLGRYAKSFDNDLEGGFDRLDFVVNYEPVVIDVIKPIITAGSAVEGGEVELVFNARGGTTIGTPREGRMKECKIIDNINGDNIITLSGDDSAVARLWSDGTPRERGGSRYTVFTTTLSNLNPGAHSYRIECVDDNNRANGVLEDFTFNTEIKTFELESDSWGQHQDTKDNSVSGIVPWIIKLKGGIQGEGEGSCSYTVGSINGIFTINTAPAGLTEYVANIDVSGLTGVKTFSASCTDDITTIQIIHPGISVEETAAPTVAQCSVGTIFNDPSGKHFNCKCGNTAVTSSDYNKYCCGGGTLANTEADCPVICPVANCKENSCVNYNDCSSASGSPVCVTGGYCCSGGCTNRGNMDVNIVSPSSEAIFTEIPVGFVLQIRTPNDVLALGECKYSIKSGRYTDFDILPAFGDMTSFASLSRDGKSQMMDINLNTLFGSLLTNGDYGYYIKCQKGERFDEVFGFVNVNIPEEIPPPPEVTPIACETSDDCPVCTTNPYCEEVEGSGNHLCDPTLKKQSCVNEVCSVDNCPTTSFNTDYCASFPDPLCLSDKDGDKISDNLDCNDAITAIGQCDRNLCRQCNEDAGSDNNRGICVAIPNCEVPVDCTDSSLDVSPTVCINAGCKWSGIHGCDSICYNTWVDSAGICGPALELNTLDECSISNLIWSNVNTVSNAYDGDVVKLKADITNCNGLNFRFEIGENDGALGIVNIDNSVDIPDITENIDITESLAEAEWEVTYLEGADIIGNTNEFVFRVIVSDGTDTIESDWSNNLNVETADIIFTGDSIKDRETFSQNNNTWKVKFGLDRSRSNVALVFDRGVSLDADGNIIVIEGTPIIMLNPSSGVYLANRQMFLNVLGLNALSVGDYQYQIFAYDSDSRSGEKSSVRSFTVVEIEPPDEGCTTVGRECKLDNNCDGHFKEDCVCIDDIPDDGCPVEVTCAGDQDCDDILDEIDREDNTPGGCPVNVFGEHIDGDNDDVCDCNPDIAATPQCDKCFYVTCGPRVLTDGDTKGCPTAVACESDACRNDDYCLDLSEGCDGCGNTVFGVMFNCPEISCHSLGECYWIDKIFNLDECLNCPNSCNGVNNQELCTEISSACGSLNCNWNDGVCEEFTPACNNGETRLGSCQPVNNCFTQETCVNGGWDRVCVDVPNDNCPSILPSPTTITINVVNPSIGTQFIQSPVQFNLVINTNEALIAGQCRYAFDKEMYVATSFPSFETMANFNSISGNSQSASVNLNTLFNLYGDGDYGYYIRCEKDNRVGERTGYINIAINTPPSELEPVPISRDVPKDIHAYLACSSIGEGYGIIEDATAVYYCLDNPTQKADCNVAKYIGTGSASVIFSPTLQGGECEGVADPCPGQNKRGNLTIWCVPLVAPPPTTQCSDGIDNDENGCADYGIDSGCSSLADNTESGGICPVVLTQCSDGIDNDGDDCKDLDDEDCGNSYDDSESGSVCGICVPEVEVCNDGRDNDCDGNADCRDISDCGQELHCRLPDCGDGTVVNGEECDRNSGNCVDLGNYGGGTWTCNNDCTINTQLCTPTPLEGPCGNNVINNGETCDGSNWGAIDECNDLDGFAGGGSLRCNTPGNINECHFNTDNCIPETSSEQCSLVYDPVCGVNGITYSNNCFARKAGVGIAYEGECSGICVPRTEICGDGVDNDCDDYVDEGCPGVVIIPIKIDSVSSSNGNVVALTSGGVGNDGSASCSVYDSIAMTNRIADLVSTSLNILTRAHIYTHTTSGTYSGWYVKCTDDINSNDFQSKIVLSFTVSGDPPPAVTPLKIDSVSSSNGNVVALTSGGVGNDGSASCSVYDSIAMTNRIADLVSTSLNILTRAHIYTHTTSGTYSGWYVKCTDDTNSNDFLSRLVPNFNVESIIVCTDEYNPVCGVNGITYSNNCFAMRAGVGIAYEGECSGICVPRIEICGDGVDNDCDGTVDEGCVCTSGSTRTCGIDTGVCSRGTQTCSNGIWGDCIGDITPVDEVCDNLDNDCDGTVDEGCITAVCGDGTCEAGETATNCPNDCGSCSNGAVRDCGVTNIGVCELGSQTCTNNRWPACSGNVNPVQEQCGDSLDNDCDGSTDELCSPCVNGATKTCGIDVGRCTTGTQTCTNNIWGVCSGIASVSEICNNNIDDDCDGIVDEGCVVSGECLINSLVWKDENGNNINNINEGGIVYGTVTGTNCNVGTTMNYKLMEKDTFLGVDELAPDDVVVESSLTFSVANFAYIEWITTRQDDGLRPDNNYYLKIGNIKSGLLIVNPVYECSDGIDNDENGCADYGIDSGCSSLADNTESGGSCPVVLTQCSDGMDNDNDGCVDLSDGDCSDANDNTESGSGCRVTCNINGECDELNNKWCNNGIWSNLNYCDNCPGDADCITPPPPIKPLKIMDKGPLTTLSNFEFELFITLTDGKDENGAATCYWNDEYNFQMSSDTVISSAFNNQILENNKEELIRGIPSTRYWTSLILANGDYTFYVRCVDADEKSTGLQELKLKVNVPDANRLKIISAEPNNKVYGVSDIDINVKTSGGLNNGKDVECIYSGDLNGDLSPSLISGNIYSHTATENTVAEGDYSLTITCADGVEVVEKDINFNVDIDNLSPEIVQIVARGGSKYIMTDEVALCKLSTTQNVGLGNDLGRDESKKRHLVVTSSSYYAQCRDEWNNQGSIVKVNV